LKRIPKYIALCGHPLSGKSTVQGILRDEFNVVPVDDGQVLRKFLMETFGLTQAQVSTQEGKLEKVTILGREWQVRELLGEFGNALEAMFGAHIMPFMAVRSTIGQPATSCFSFGSVRRDQGLYYKQLGGLVIGIANPKAKQPKFEFDRFDPAVVDVWINNDGLARGLTPAEAMKDLRGKISDAIANAPKLAKAA